MAVQYFLTETQYNEIMAALGQLDPAAINALAGRVTAVETAVQTAQTTADTANTTANNVKSSLDAGTYWAKSELQPYTTPSGS